MSAFLLATLYLPSLWTLLILLLSVEASDNPGDSSKRWTRCKRRVWWEGGWGRWRTPIHIQRNGSESPRSGWWGQVQTIWHKGIQKFWNLLSYPWEGNLYTLNKVKMVKKNCLRKDTILIHIQYYRMPNTEHTQDPPNKELPRSML